jgi:phenylacetate-CoA ligase
MSTITDTGADVLSARFGSALAGRLEDHVGRLSWTAERLVEHQREQLRALLACAVERSPFHAPRLAGIDPERFELDQLSELPVMSKPEMMTSFDELLTDRRLTRARVERQLAASDHEPTLAYDRYVCLASGGSSGLRGLFVQSVEEYAEFAASVLRRAMARVFAAGGPPPGGLPVAIVAAASPVHSSGFAAAVARGYPVRMISAPATMAIGEIVRRLNDAQPPVLLAHASTLALLASEQRAGRLRISPRAITGMSELLTDQARIAIGDAFAVPPVNQFVWTEGLVGHSDPGGTSLSFATDMCIAELVDENNQPVPDGVSSAKVLVTNLHNRTQPLIRYDLTDQFTKLSAVGGPYLTATVDGRGDEVFRYEAITLDPLIIRTVMVRTPAAIEYQVQQTSHGIDIDVVTDSELDQTALTVSLEQSMRSAGLADPVVRVREVAEIARHRQSGKTRRFITL